MTSVPMYFFAIGGSLSILEMRQFIASLNTELKVLETFRGNQIVSPRTVNLDLLDDVINKMASWFMANTDEAGRLPYKFWPSRGEESEADNPIRRFMATIALNRLAQARKDAAMARAAQRNLAFNLSRFYSEECGFGKISCWASAQGSILHMPRASAWLRGQRLRQGRPHQGCQGAAR